MTIDIKICGLKTEEGIASALACGATHVGFIFYPRSPRAVVPETAGRLRQTAKGKAKAVAVTVDLSDDELDAIVTGMAPDMLQLHGEETPERVAYVKARYGIPVMKAFSVHEAADLDAVKSYRGIADRFMFDAKPLTDLHLPGGNGLPFDWHILAGLDRDIDYVLSGGLNPANIGDAIRFANPPGVDVSSGVESSPGVKDPARIAEFVRAVAAARKDRAA